ncbi:hypothetical protein [Micromonospora zhanjiangensis]|uniref:Flavin reductase n=1 Tax=Micromonospora zhanjiangensis TaxID=1522057 RepID=A0ABV8KES1_9ACTN
MPLHLYRGREVTPAPRPPHVPRRPLWLCRACSENWPCPTARLKLKAEYGDDRTALIIYLCGLLHEAIEDMNRLHPDNGPDPGSLFNRIVGWARPRTHIE